MIKQHTNLLKACLTAIVLISLQGGAAQATYGLTPVPALEAISVTRLDAGTIQWLSITEMPELVSRLRQATPSAGSTELLWEYCITIVTEQGEASCYYSTTNNLICFPPYTGVMHLPDDTAEFFNALFDNRSSGASETITALSSVTLNRLVSLDR